MHVSMLHVCVCMHVSMYACVYVYVCVLEHRDAVVGVVCDVEHVRLHLLVALSPTEVRAGVSIEDTQRPTRLNSRIQSTYAYVYTLHSLTHSHPHSLTHSHPPPHSHLSFTDVFAHNVVRVEGQAHVWVDGHLTSSWGGKGDDDVTTRDADVKMRRGWGC